ncbi:MAG: succinate dehydrogenase iron-sulfur subunit [Halobacteria archaeon]
MSVDKEVEVKFKVFRFNPKIDFVPRWQEYNVRVDKSTTILDALLKIKEEQDPTLTIRYSCRQAVCGSCGMMINDKQMLACFTRVLELGSSVVKVAPLKNYRIIKDLVTDFEELFQKERQVKPYVIRHEVEELLNPTGTYKQTEDELLGYIQFADCIECGMCSSACPVSATDPLYLGPMVLNRAYRFISDPRDLGLEQRLEVIDSEHGCWRCHFAASCSAVCPKGVDPAKAIQLLRRMLVKKAVLGTSSSKKVDLIPMGHIKGKLELPKGWQ